MDISTAAPVAPPEPAEPVLASQVISDEELDDLVDSVFHASISKRKSEKNRLKTNVKSVDYALGGGLESAAVVCVSGEAAAGTSEVSSYERQHEHTPLPNYQEKRSRIERMKKNAPNSETLGRTNNKD